MLNEAIKFATEAHEGQFRKETGLPYIVHPLEVMTTLQQKGETDEEILTAALLHDVIEDVGLSNEIKRTFGNRVHSIVLEVTKAETKEKTLEKLANASREAQLVKIADIHSNTRAGEIYPGYYKKKKEQLSVMTKLEGHQLYEWLDFILEVGPATL